MITRPGQDFIEAERTRRTKREAALKVLARSPRLARISRHFAKRIVWPNHQCYGDEICSYCHHQDEVAAAMTTVARGHARRALAGHVFDNEIEAALRAVDAVPAPQPKRRKRGKR